MYDHKTSLPIIHSRTEREDENTQTTVVKGLPFITFATRGPRRDGVVGRGLCGLHVWLPQGWSDEDGGDDSGGGGSRMAQLLIPCAAATTGLPSPLPFLDADQFSTCSRIGWSGVTGCSCRALCRGRSSVCPKASASGGDTSSLKVYADFQLVKATR